MRSTRENRRFSKWKKVRDDFFHRALRVLEAVARAEGIPNKVVDTVIVCRKQMGRDEMAVVDGKLAVHGLEGLRIADGSVLPRVTIGNTITPLCRHRGTGGGDRQGPTGMVTTALRRWQESQVSVSACWEAGR